MKIDITKEQYATLMIMSGFTQGIFGILGDALPDADYQERSTKFDELQQYLLQFASEMGHSEFVEEFEGEKLLSEDFYETSIAPIMTDYDEYTLYDDLANELAWRDFRREHTQEQLKKMSEKNNNYFGVELYDYEKKYWDEFDEHEFNRLEIIDKSKNKPLSQ